MVIVVMVGGLTGSLGLSWALLPNISFTLPLRGFTFYGGLLGGGAALLALCIAKRWRLLDTLDQFAPAVAIGHGFGRIGCFFAGCCHGAPSGPVWGALGCRTVPVQLMEAGCCFAIGAVLLAVARQPARCPGRLTAAYLITYGLCRLATERLRGDYRGEIAIGDWTINSPSSAIAAAMILVGGMVAATRYGPKRADA
jgi:phosphatidylglycerol:prolipoprotein diacylglycerol transferase